MSVDLPAPFAPSRPIALASDDTVTSSSATIEPNRLVRRSVAIVGSTGPG